MSLGHGHDIPEPNLYHQGISSVLFANRRLGADYFKFSFVRNPWARLLSLYEDFTKKRIYQYSAKIRHEKPLFSEFRDFEDFCVNVRSTPWWDDIFLRSQTALLSHDGKMVMDAVGRFETLTTDFSKICCKIFGKPVTIQHHNAGIYNKEAGYRSYYSKKAEYAVAEIYKDDIEAFNYDF